MPSVDRSDRRAPGVGYLGVVMGDGWGDGGLPWYGSTVRLPVSNTAPDGPSLEPDLPPSHRPLVNGRQVATSHQYGDYRAGDRACTAHYASRPKSSTRD